ncbi:single-stranded DNA-binding protein [Lysinibacillus pakistanensis]|uniref:Single-stranded DNA-binding protein n=1 Tax=Lysinibacillus pakistanensis TaxID=759811 RepID=A0AAX3WYD1_9BACI|nr:single-stranded DNA-binding protein [Lysinibacillus pakistanensis]MDM5231740.1 single-stranded DNA-binding protein [Lysinibacillus pakistanensis]WHY47280.1 single-stranded DNA-binding protein [Lysinibacillus pakistanensis]WHY52289.1 single-stranded DNA-binding protein [Lysinibacillus pakistanensis]
MNQVGLVGRLTKDPVLRHLSENRVQTHFSLAINRNYKNNRGEVDADFILCTVWGRLAEHIVKYCGKGSLIGANGRIQSRSFVNEQSTKIFITEVVVEEVRFYHLKPRNSDEAIVPTKLSDEQEGLKDFVLPEAKAVLPVV